MQEPKDTTHHYSGELNEEGLCEEWMKLEIQLGIRPAVDLNGTIDESRKALEAGCAFRDSQSLTDELKSGVTAHDEIINVTTTEQTTEHQIPVRIYHPTSATNHSAPAALFFHGGGWILGSVAADDLFCRKLALDLKHVVISVEYRLAPESVFPAAIDDCYSACLWASENAQRLGIDPRMIYVTGNSAGGHLAAAVALKMVESGKGSTIAAQVLRIPLTCHPFVWPGVKPLPKGNMPVLTDSAAVSMLDAFVPNEKDQTNCLVSPLLASPELLRKLPPTYIDVCTADPLAAGGIAYAKKLEEHGVPVKLFVLDGMPHGSYVLFPGLASSVAAHTACMAGTEWALDVGKQKDCGNR